MEKTGNHTGPFNSAGHWRAPEALVARLEVYRRALSVAAGNINPDGW